MAHHDANVLFVPTSFGTLVARRVGDAGVYDEIEIDLVTEDGCLRQVSVVGATEPSDVEAAGLHSYVWVNPASESPDWNTDIVVGDPASCEGGCWYGEAEDGVSPHA